MFAKRLLQKVKNNFPPQNVQHGCVPANLDPHISLHYGIPSTSSILAFDPVQRLMAIGTLDGRIKVVGGDNVEGLLISPKQLPYKYLEFLHNQGFLLSVTNENVIQVWDLEHRLIACSLQWDSNITAFSVIRGTYFMYLGDEYGLVSVLKYDAEAAKLLQLPYHFPANYIAEAAGVSVPLRQSVVGVLPQPCSSGNRVLIVYENGLIILWDVSEARVLLVKGYNDLQLKDAEVISSSSGVTNELTDDISEPEQEEKEISSVCWASSSGSILAVGYVDGDIMLWNMSSASSTKGQQAGISSNDVVKLQLSSGGRRLPVIVLHWAANCSSDNDRGGQLFIYGGDDIGSEEVLTVLSLEWSSGKDALKCVNRVDLTLDGSFADMILIPNAGPTEKNPIDALFVLTNPGQLHVYDDASLSAFSSQQDKIPVRAMPFPLVIPTLEPYMTTAKLCSVPNGGTSSRVLMELASVRKNGSTATLAAGTKWPLTGGIPCKLSFSEDNGVERLYMAGYQDGSVRIWDATYPVLSLISVLEGEVKNVEVAGASSPVSALNFCSPTTTFAVGHESGLVCIYKLGENSDEKSFHFVSETKHEVHIIHQEKELHCRAAFSILNSPIRALQEATSGAKLAVGFECGKVAMLDMSSLSVLFLTDCVSGSSSPVISMDIKAYTDIDSLINGSKHQGSKTPQEPVDEELFILTKDSHIVVVNSITGSIISCWPMHQKKESTAISMFIIDSSSSVAEASLSEQTEQLSKDTATKSEPVHVNTLDGVETQEVELLSSKTKMCGDKASDSLVLLCCEDALHVFSLKSVIQGDNSSIHKVNLAKPCCWTATFKEKDEKAWGLILLYQSGVIEIRSLPDLEITGESSLMSILRWSFKSNMEKTISSSDRGLITLVNGCELAFISLFASVSGFRTPESLPCLYDKVLAAAADAAISFSSTNKKKQVTSPGILGIIKGFKGEKMAQAMDYSTTYPLSDVTQHLESVFSRDPFAKLPEIDPVIQEVLELNIDDIEIDEPLHVVPISSKKGKNDTKGKESEREKLFQGASVDTKPRMRTPEEIMAKYRKAGDASAAAAQARDKLVQRQEKLERISKRTEELQDGAQNFASMANELVKTMEARKWWNI